MYRNTNHVQACDRLVEPTFIYPFWNSLWGGLSVLVADAQSIVRGCRVNMGTTGETPGEHYFMGDLDR